MRKLITSVFLVFLIVASTNAWGQTAPYNRTEIVTSTGVPTTDGTALLAAVSGLSPAPSSSNRWLIQLEGGFYDIGSTPLQIPQFVSLVGTGIYNTFIDGSYDPSPSLVGGLVRGASSSEIRDLTIRCLSTAAAGCQALSLQNANARLTDMRVLSQGTGTGDHLGIRTLNSKPRLDRVQVVLTSSTADNNYGIIYGGTSEVEIYRSEFIIQDADTDNWAIGVSDSLAEAKIRDTIMTVSGGTTAAGVFFDGSSTSIDMLFENVTINSTSGTQSYGIGRASSGDTSQPHIYYRHGSIYASTHGIDHVLADIDVVNSEIYATTVWLSGDVVNVGGSWMRDTGTLSGTTSLECAGNFDEDYRFFASSCP